MKINKWMIFAIVTFVYCGAIQPALAQQVRAVQAQVQHVNGTVIKGKLRWLPASRKYAVISVSEGGREIEQQWSPSEVAKMQVAAPQGWQALIKQASTSPDAALPKLNSIIREYKMLQYDEAAAYYAASIYMQKNQAEEALKICEEIIKEKPSAGSTSVMAPVYWKAMLETGKTGGGRLEKMLDEAVASAPRTVAAMALIARGDLYKKEGRSRDALKDGYLRVALLFSTEKGPHAEALYKASEVFDELHQTSHADKMRQTLLSRHADSEYAKKLRGGN